MTEPTPEQWRTAARVLRFVASQIDKEIDELPRMRRWWERLTFDTAQIRAQAAILEEEADDIEESRNEGGENAPVRAEKGES